VADVIFPHFDLPFRFAADKHGRVVQQDTEADVTNCVHACLRTTRGTRFYLPNFGITDPTFQNAPVDLTALEREVAENEYRAHMAWDQTIDVIRDFINVQVGVDIV
jgi:phage baseplate assembly protein W